MGKKHARTVVNKVVVGTKLQKIDKTRDELLAIIYRLCSLFASSAWPCFPLLADLLDT